MSVVSAPTNLLSSSQHSSGNLARRVLYKKKYGVVAEVQPSLERANKSFSSSNNLLRENEKVNCDKVLISLRKCSSVDKGSRVLSPPEKSNVTITRLPNMSASSIPNYRNNKMRGEKTSKRSKNHSHYKNGIPSSKDSVNDPSKRKGISTRSPRSPCRNPEFFVKKPPLTIDEYIALTEKEIRRARRKKSKSRRSAAKGSFNSSFIGVLTNNDCASVASCKSTSKLSMHSVRSGKSATSKISIRSNKSAVSYASPRSDGSAISRVSFCSNKSAKRRASVRSPISVLSANSDRSARSRASFRSCRNTASKSPMREASTRRKKNISSSTPTRSDRSKKTIETYGNIKSSGRKSPGRTFKSPKRRTPVRTLNISTSKSNVKNAPTGENPSDVDIYGEISTDIIPDNTHETPVVSASDNTLEDAAKACETPTVNISDNTREESVQILKTCGSPTNASCSSVYSPKSEKLHRSWANSVVNGSSIVEVRRDSLAKAENKRLVRADSNISGSSNASHLKANKRQVSKADTSQDKSSRRKMTFKVPSLDKLKHSSDSNRSVKTAETDASLSSIEPLASFDSVLSDSQWEYIQSQWENVETADDTDSSSQVISTDRPGFSKKSASAKFLMAKQLSTIMEFNDDMKPSKLKRFLSKLRKSPKALSKVSIGAEKKNISCTSSTDSSMISKTTDTSFIKNKGRKEGGKKKEKKSKKKEKKINESNNPCNIAVVGPPASGKHTQGKKIAKKIGAIHISASDLLRDAIENKTAKGLVIEEYVHESQSVPDVIISKMVTDRLKESDCQTQGWVLSGFPNTLGQAEALLTEGMKFEHFFVLDTPYEVLKSRIEGRSYDPVTGSRYHVTYLPSWNPKVTMRLKSIDSTDREVIDGVKEFNKSVKLLKQCYSDILFEVDGTQKPTNVYKDIYKHAVRKK